MEKADLEGSLEELANARAILESQKDAVDSVLQKLEQVEAALRAERIVQLNATKADMGFNVLIAKAMNPEIGNAYVS